MFATVSRRFSHARGNSQHDPAWRRRLALEPLEQRTMLSVLFYDDFPGTIVSSANWHIPTWVSSTDGTYVGRTQFRCTQHSSLPAASNSNAVITVETYNPTGFSFYGTDLISNESFSVGEGIDITFRARMTTTTPGIVGGLYMYALEPGSNTLHDEIDFELLTNSPNQVETNVYADEPLGTGHPLAVSYPSGSITDYHTYQIQWLPNQVSWLVDGTLIRTDTSNVPAGPMYVNLNMWVPDSAWPEAYSASLQPTSSPGSDQVFSMLVDWACVSTHQTVTSIAVSPATVAMNAGTTQQFTAVAYDQSGSLLIAQPAFTWSTTVGSISSAGLLTAPGSPASGTVTATSEGVAGTGDVTVTSLTATTLNLGGTSFSFTGGLTPAKWTVVVSGVPVTNIPATTTAVSFTGAGGSATASITGASPSGESAAISLGQAVFDGVGSSGTYTVTATNLLSATVTSGGSGSLSVTDAIGGNVLTELPASTTLASSSNSASEAVAKGFNNVVATATGAGSGTVAELFGSNAADTFTANPRAAVMQGAAQTAYRLEADGFTTVHAIGGTGGDTALLTGAAGGAFNATGSMAMLSGSGYNITVNNFASVQATAVGPSDVAYLQAGPGTNVFSGGKGKSEFKGVNFDNVAKGFFSVYAYGAAAGYNTAVLTDSTGSATATLNPQTATLTDASTSSPASYQIGLPSGFQVIQVFEAALLGNNKAILNGSSTAANSFTSTSTTATLVPSAGNAYREYEQGFATVQATSTYATDTASLFDSPGSDTFTAMPTSATMRLATGKTVVVAGFKTVNAYSIYGGTDTANLTGTTGADAAWLWSTNALMKMSIGNTVRAWYFAKYNLDGDGGGDAVTTLNAAVLPKKQTTVAGARIIAWLADFSEINQDYSPGSQGTNQSYGIAADQVLTAYWS